MSLLDGVLATERTEVWSGVTIKHGVSFADLHLWFASFLPGFCKLAADKGTDLATERKSWFPFGVVRGDSFAYLAVRPALDGAGIEFGGSGLRSAWRGCCCRDGRTDPGVGPPGPWRLSSHVRLLADRHRPSPDQREHGRAGEDARLGHDLLAVGGERRSWSGCLATLRSMYFRWDWLRPVVAAPYVPTLGPVHPGVLSAEFFDAVVGIADTGRFLPYDKGRRWAKTKDEQVIVEEIVHRPGLTMIPTVTRGRGLVKLYHYGESPPQLSNSPSGRTSGVPASAGPLVGSSGFTTPPRVQGRDCC
jgi:hypothetical protein